MNSNVSYQQGLIMEAHCPLTMPISKQPLTDTYTADPKPFARGKFATVRRCKHKETGVEYAAKCIRKRRRAADVRHEIMHEMFVLKLSDSCQHIIHLHEVYETSSEVILVLEMAAGGELQRVLDDQEVIAETEASRVMRQILEGVAFLHQRGIAHLDIKPQNLLLTQAFPQCDVKLCDFGISRRITKGSEIREILGTPDYVSPEILQYEPISLATDMWSIGVLAYVLLSGHTPFGGETKQETFWNITSGIVEFPEELFGSVSNDAKDFIQRLLITEPSERMTAKESLHHSWIRMFCDPESPGIDVAKIGYTLKDESNAEVSVSAEVAEEVTNGSEVHLFEQSQEGVGVVEGKLQYQMHLIPVDHHQSNGTVDKEVTSSSEKPHPCFSNLSPKNRAVSEMEEIIVGFEGHNLNKRMIITDERMSMVY
ncbi:serine/threonine-protein kinase 17B-like [Limulus polyphemus]|uniref:Serine/threonine-protein kinase 17B-like n=1 Tax=Limulus polyphemus TaxID=6850 RepID=A0ABM1TF16_LIMPO|nr:serine/threonine-protein kinase 17B-like [Limulus polyphemus]XP_022254472.1 serine/threonine-protein kinase 17B-like [Limulus polyphemus]